jgi:Uma2 family endonuclease
VSLATTTNSTTAPPPPFEVPGPVTRVPSLEEIRELTNIPERRVVFRSVDWPFYEKLIDSIPETSNIHVDYDGKDLEVMGKGPRHEGTGRVLGLFIDIVTSDLKIDRAGLAETTWKRAGVARGLEADDCYYFAPEKLAANAAAIRRRSDDIADYPNPDLAVEVDISRPQVDRAGIYAALRVPEIWRLDGRKVVIEQLARDGTYQVAEKSLFIPVSALDIERWVLLEDAGNELAWEAQLRAWIRSKLGNAAPGGGGMKDVQNTLEPFAQMGETDS